MKLKPRSRTSVIAATLLLLPALACRPAPDPSADDARSSARAAPPAAEGAPSGVVVILDGAAAAQVRVEEVRSEPIPELLTATGKVQFNEDRIARVIAPVSGPVLGLKVNVGDRVTQGESLLQINSREVAAALAEHLESHKDLELAEKTVGMTRDLFGHQAASRMALQQAESDLAKTRARVDRTEQSLRILGADGDAIETSLQPRIAIRAPISGIVIERRVTDGQFVQPDGTALVVLADLSSVWVLADVFERDLHRVHAGQRAEVRAAAYPAERFAARVARIADTVDPTTRTVKVRFLVPNPAGRLKPEMFAAVTLVVGESIPVLTVPAKAVFTQGDRAYVFVAESADRFARRDVDVAPHASGRTRVLRGLQPGERIVSDGVLLMSSAVGQARS